MKKNQIADLLQCVKIQVIMYSNKCLLQLTEFLMQNIKAHIVQLYRIMGACLAGCYSCFCCECNFMIFPAPTPSYSQHKHQHIIDYFQNSSGKKVPYLSLQSKNAKINIIFFHGNAEDIGYSLNFLQPIQQKLSANIYAIQYPSYGQYHCGFPARISNGIKNDGLQFYQFLKRNKQQVVNANNTIIVGRSIGSGGACYLASRKKINNLILISPFSTIPNVAVDFVGCMGRIVKCHFDNLEQLKDYHGRLLVIHGKADEVIAFRHGKLVAEEYNSNNPEKCELLCPTYMSHNSFDYTRDILTPIYQFCKNLNHDNTNMKE